MSTAREPAAADLLEVAGTTALKEWGAAVHALLDGRQTVLLRKGGIHEKAFTTAVAAGAGGVLLYPTVAHTHAERTRPEHQDLLAPGDADADEDAVVVRAAAQLVDVIEVARPDRLPAIADLHIWTDRSIQEDRVDFRPVKPLQVLVVRAIELPTPVRLPRTEAHGGCRSWIDVEVPWAGEGRVVHDDARLHADAERVRSAVA